MSPEQMREFVRNEYRGPNWSSKVDGMTDQQIFAVYNRILNKKRTQS